jgi:hypothetical protein
VREQPGEPRADDEAETECGTEKSERLRALVGFGHVCDIGTGDRDVAA